MPTDTAQMQPESAPDKTRNGADFLSHLDKRRRDVKRLRARYAEYRDQLGHAPSPSDETLLKQAATLSVRMEDLAADLGSGKTVDDDMLIRTGGALNRTLYRLGLVTLAPAPAASPSLAPLTPEERAACRRERRAQIVAAYHANDANALARIYLEEVRGVPLTPAKLYEDARTAHLDGMSDEEVTRQYEEAKAERDLDPEDPLDREYARILRESTRRPAET